MPKILSAIPVLSAILGCVAWAPWGWLPLALLLPGLCFLARSRGHAFAIVVSFSFGAAWRIAPAATVFTGHVWAGIAMLALYSVVFSAPFLLLWKKNPSPFDLAWRAPAILAGQVIPPYGYIVILPSLAGAGELFPGTRWYGLAAAVFFSVAFALFLTWQAKRHVIVVILSALLTFSYIANQLYHTSAPLGWRTIDTQLGALQDGYENYYHRQKILIGLVRQALQVGYPVIVLPENVMGYLTPASAYWWNSTIVEARQKGATLLAGALKGSDKGVVAMGQANGFAPAEQPVPFMEDTRWHWKNSGNVATIHGKRTGFVICYETFVGWPVLMTAAHSEIMVVMINAWWDTTNTSSIEVKTAASWAKLFGLPVLSAVNR